jgi:hypothetical protein
MPEYTNHINQYVNYWYADFSKITPLSEWGNKKSATTYMEKYWLDEKEYFKIWKPIQDKIFIQNSSLPSLIYHSDFKIIVSNGGCLLTEKDFKQLQRVMQKIGEEYFVIIQHTQEFTHSEPMFRMKFPTSITWKELMSGNYISAVLFEMHYNEYYIFGESAHWGRYSATDYEFPFSLIGIKSQYASIFKKYFSLSKKELDTVQKWLPPEYKNRIAEFKTK